jgi:hypothetical protein
VLRGRTKALGVLLALLAVPAGAAFAAVVQDGDVRVSILSQIAPYRLPRAEPAPISVFVAGHVEATHGGVPPQLRRMKVEVNRHGLLQAEGLPVCAVSQIKTATTREALRTCTPALIGSGRFWAHIVLADQAPYATHGRLLIFNGKEGTRSMILAHIFTSNPFPSSFVVPFAISRIHRGAFGTSLTAPLPQALGDWGYVDRIKLNLKRRYRFHGRRLSYFNAACPAAAGTDRAGFPLARATFYFQDRRPLRGTVDKACGVRR